MQIQSRRGEGHGRENVMAQRTGERMLVAAASLTMLLSCGREPGVSTPRATLHDIRMGCCPGAFEPGAISVVIGDTIRFINTDTDTHDVAFRRRQMPVGGVEQLRKNMPGAYESGYADDITLPALRARGQSLVSLAGVPPGTYQAYCTFHLGMTLTLTVLPAGSQR